MNNLYQVHGWLVVKVKKSSLLVNILRPLDSFKFLLALRTLYDFFSVPWQFLWLSSKGANAVNLQAILGLNSKLMVDFGQDQSLCWYLLSKHFFFRDITNFTLHTNVKLTFGSRIFQSVFKIWFPSYSIKYSTQAVQDRYQI